MMEKDRMDYDGSVKLDHRVRRDSEFPMLPEEVESLSESRSLERITLRNRSDSTGVTWVLLSTVGRGEDHL